MQREVFRIAVPSFFTAISIPLLGAVDTALMGHETGTVSLAALGLGSMIFNLMYWSFGFLRMSTLGMTAQSLGSGNTKAPGIILGRSLMIAVLLGITLIALEPFLWWLALHALTLLNSEASAGVVAATSSYFAIRLWAAPASLSIYALLGWFLGMQNAKWPLFFTVLVNVSNIVISLILVRYYGMGVEGAAWGTVAAQYLGMVTCLAIVFLRYSSRFENFRWADIVVLKHFKKFMFVSRDLIVRTMLLLIVLNFHQAASFHINTTVLNVNQILMQLFYLFAFGLDGFAYAAESLTGKYLGQKDNGKLKQVISLVFKWSYGIAALFTVVYWLWGHEVSLLFLDDAQDKNQVIEGLKTYGWWMLLIPAVCTLCFVWDGVYIGATASRGLRNSMILSFLAYALSWYLTRPMGYDGLWLSFMVFMLVRGFTLQLFSGREIYRS